MTHTIILIIIIVILILAFVLNQRYMQDRIDTEVYAKIKWSLKILYSVKNFRT